LFGFVGEDGDGTILERQLREAGIDSRMTVVPGHPTTTKLRVLCGKQQMLRLDMEETDGYPADVHRILIEKIETAMPSADAVVLSDYAKGVLTEDVCQHAIRAARRGGIPVLVDPKQHNFARYRGATTICPNLAELSVAAGIGLQNLDSVLAAGQRLMKELDLD